METVVIFSAPRSRNLAVRAVPGVGAGAVFEGAGTFPKAKLVGHVLLSRGACAAVQADEGTSRSSCSCCCCCCRSRAVLGRRFHDGVVVPVGVFAARSGVSIRAKAGSVSIVAVDIVIIIIIVIIQSK